MAEQSTVRGEFEVKLSPQDKSAGDGDITRMLLDKSYRGALSGTGQGQMMSAMGTVEGSAVYVAMERVTGSLDGKEGSFVLHHRGTMDRGEATLEIAIVPDSGEGALSGLRGTMDIINQDGAHEYVLSYSLNAPSA